MSTSKHLREIKPRWIRNLARIFVSRQNQKSQTMPDCFILKCSEHDRHCRFGWIFKVHSEERSLQKPSLLTMQHHGFLYILIDERYWVFTGTFLHGGTTCSYLDTHSGQNFERSFHCPTVGCLVAYQYTEETHTFFLDKAIQTSISVFMINSENITENNGIL